MHAESIEMAECRIHSLLSLEPTFTVDSNTIFIMQIKHC